jgi:hypothetical protein
MSVVPRICLPMQERACLRYCLEPRNGSRAWASSELANVNFPFEEQYLP